MNPRTRFRVNTPTVTHETIDGESVIVNLGTGNYYSLQGTGAQIWALVEQNQSAEAMIACLKHCYPAAAGEIDLCVPRLLGEMLEEQLIVAEPMLGAAPLRPEILPSPGAFETPALQKFTDMQELLLLDPIHEVDEAGWPQKKADVTV